MHIQYLANKPETHGDQPFNVNQLIISRSRYSRQYTWINIFVPENICLESSIFRIFFMVFRISQHMQLFKTLQDCDWKWAKRNIWHIQWKNTGYPSYSIFTSAL